mmetsp:Transcript_15494/g.29230  ORF Transcript_15494/g.29230 Transcript_15494/m.29230 type:complete len:938 (+) Transcript_15494:1861-4674(+)
MNQANSGTPSKFAFLSGIHPDLDAALCECEADYAAVEYGHEQYSSQRMPQHHQSQARSVHDENQRNGPANLTGSLYSDEFIRRTKQHSSGFDERVESSCDMNESVDSIPFSIDGMERAKSKIKLQAAKIRDLEEKLKRMSIIENTDMQVENCSTRKILTPQERLAAHRERKNSENKFKDKCGRWESPPPINRHSLVSKVKPRDDFVDRLVSSPKERRRQEEISRRISLSKVKAERNVMTGARENSPLVRRQSIEEEIKSVVVSNKEVTDVINNFGARDCLMKRLSMTVDERRDLERKQVLAAVKRVIEKRQKIEDGGWERMQDNLHEKETKSKFGTVADVHQVSCHTCGSIIGCEEDTDDPGTFYCSRCWEEYENQCLNNNEVMKTSELHSHNFPPNNAFEMASSSMQCENTLWIVHDDPKLSSRLICSGRNKMRCFIETKDPAERQCLRILHGTIDYSGPVVNSGYRAQMHTKETSRGTEWICIGNIQGYVIYYDTEKLNLNADQSLYEFRLEGLTSTQFAGRNAEASVKEFLEGCVGAVDVIFDPHHSPDGWYPIVEATSLRKIAPQFRSKGIGYIRLGDDMGKNGQAFMSSDGCRTFLFNEPVERENKSGDLLRTASSFTSRHSKSSQLQSHRKSFQQGTQSQRSSGQILIDEDGEASLSSTSSGSSNITAGDVLKELQSLDISKGMKWSEKAELLMKLGKVISRPEARSWSESSLNYLQDVISAKNVNIHVLRSALVVIEKIGHVLKEELPNQIAWKTILIETLKLLKNKQCGGAVREVLKSLHGKCYTIANSLHAISHVLGMGKQTPAMQRKLNSKTDLVQQSKANNVEVIEWLAVTTESERLLDNINPSMDTSELELLATFFLRHESHRDARCRQNALDGLLHTMLYGIEVLGMRLADVQLLCGDLKNTKPKSWNRLMRSLQLVLKVQQIK